MQQFLQWFTKLYPVWLVGTAILAFFMPPPMLWFAAQGFTEIAVESDLGILRQAYQGILNTGRMSQSYQ